MNDTSQPTLVVDGLKTHFFTRGGVAKAVDGVSFSIRPGEILGLVGESGSGKSMTGYSIMGLIDPPGRIVGGEILFRGQDLTKLDEESLRELRGNRIAMVFQDPMMTLNPVLRISTQMIETIRALAALANDGGAGIMGWHGGAFDVAVDKDDYFCHRAGVDDNGAS